MAVTFTFKTELYSLITKDEYPLYLDRKNSFPNEIGVCEVQVIGHEIHCSAVIGGTEILTNDKIIAEVNQNDVLEGKYTSGLLIDVDANGDEYVSGISLEKI